MLGLKIQYACPECETSELICRNCISARFEREIKILQSENEILSDFREFVQSNGLAMMDISGNKMHMSGVGDSRINELQSKLDYAITLLNDCDSDDFDRFDDLHHDELYDKVEKFLEKNGIKKKYKSFGLRKIIEIEEQGNE